MLLPLVNYALEQVVGENRQETLFDERRLTRDASTAEFYESLFGADEEDDALTKKCRGCLLYTSPSPRDQRGSRMPSSA